MMAPRNQGDTLLNENQERSLTLSLRRLEKLLTRLEREADWPEEQGRLYLLQNSLKDQTRQNILRELTAQARAEIIKLADFFNLPSESADRAIHFRGELIIMWEGLVEKESRYLRGFGKVNPALAQFLDPSIEYLVQLVLKMQAICDPES